MATTTAKTSPLTERQLEIYRWYYERTMEDGYQPSVYEVMERFGFTSTNAVVCVLHALVAKGWISTPHGNRRSVRFLCRPDGQPFAGFKDK